MKILKHKKREMINTLNFDNKYNLKIQSKNLQDKYIYLRNNI